MICQCRRPLLQYMQVTALLMYYQDHAEALLYIFLLPVPTSSQAHMNGRDDNKHSSTLSCLSWQACRIFLLYRIFHFPYMHRQFPYTLILFLPFEPEILPVQEDAFRWHMIQMRKRKQKIPKRKALSSYQSRTVCSIFCSCERYNPAILLP